jgi:replication fork protection complex subunit Tof1/Swi1
MDLTKKSKSKKGNTVDEMARDDNLSLEARTILQGLAREFVESCFNRMSVPVVSFEYDLIV